MLNDIWVQIHMLNIFLENDDIKQNVYVSLST